ncbi:MAG: PTS sugar transporter subunit IIA [Planctomycetes bacterium]|nr:PTS sugar transporter subunit IIA [Planctomycetota bacterium]
MKVATYLKPEAVLLRPAASDKWQLIEKLCRQLCEANGCSAKTTNAAVKAVLEREKSASTGMDGGVAVPHAAVDDLPSLMVGMAVMPEGIEFKAIDNSITTVIVMILVPKSQKLGHLRLLAEVARRLSDLGFQQHMFAASSTGQVVDLWL